MSIRRRWTWRWAGIAGVAAAGISPTSSTAKSSVVRPAAPPPTPCTTSGTGLDCAGTLITLGKGWSGPPNSPALADTTIKRLYDVVKAFPSGSSATVQRKSKNGKKILVALEAIQDAQLVYATTITHPVVVAKMTLDSKSDDDEDYVYGVNKQWDFYVVVSPDKDDGSPDGMSRWDVIGIKKPFLEKPKAKIVKWGVKYRACMTDGQYDENKSYPFAFFSTCPAAHTYPLAVLTAAQGVSLLPDASRADARKSFLQKYGANLAPALDGDDPIWITCGLGCCTVSDS